MFSSWNYSLLTPSLEKYLAGKYRIGVCYPQPIVLSMNGKLTLCDNILIVVLKFPWRIVSVTDCGIFLDLKLTFMVRKM